MKNTIEFYIKNNDKKQENIIEIYIENDNKKNRKI